VDHADKTVENGAQPVRHFVRKRAGSALVAKYYLHKTSDRPGDPFVQQSRQPYDHFELTLYTNFGYPLMKTKIQAMIFVCFTRWIILFPLESGHR
jgi:hypothetical protein